MKLSEYHFYREKIITAMRLFNTQRVIHTNRKSDFFANNPIGIEMLVCFYYCRYIYIFSGKYFVK